MDAVIFGEALVDLVSKRDAIYPFLGGGPFNTARVLGDLLKKTAFFGAISDDNFGLELQKALDEKGIFLHKALRINAPTSLAFAHLDSSGAASYQFYFDGTSANALSLLQTKEVLKDSSISKARAFYTGALGLVLDPLFHSGMHLLGHYAKNSLVMIDPNVRGGIIDLQHSDIKLSRDIYLARLKQALDYAHILKLSIDDLDFIAKNSGIKMPSTSDLSAFTELGEILKNLYPKPHCILLTLGENGGVLYAKGKIEHIKAPKVNVIDTIGAGDVTSGVFLALILKNNIEESFKRGDFDFELALKFATIAINAASESTTKAGANIPKISI
ncbi:MAG: PfkB family carbohydrate kinase [Helicobacter sp.]|nr:PfkB family carbohydrate kinase [Helicobacter sp.]